MDFFIVTPSFNQLDQLKCCVASVKDQVNTDIFVHHHIQDNDSSDGTIEFLRDYTSNHKLYPINNYQFSYSSSLDQGMYDAINIGWKSALNNNSKNFSYDILSWINCDEQYLEDTLKKVSKWLLKNENKSLVFGNVLIIDEFYNLKSVRKIIKPFRNHVISDHLPLFSAAMFIRSSLIKSKDLYLNTNYKNIADVELYLRIVKYGISIGIINQFLSTYMDSGKNLSLENTANKEYNILRKNYSSYILLLKYLWILLHRFMKLIKGCYLPKSLHFSIYTHECLGARQFRHHKLNFGIWFKRISNKKQL